MYNNRFGDEMEFLFLQYAGTLLWTVFLYFVMIWVSLTVWQRHLQNLLYMRRAALMFLATLAVPLATVLVLAGYQSVMMKPPEEAFTLLVVFFSAVAITGTLLGSFLFFMLSILPQKKPVSRETPLPVREPWED